MEEEFEAGFFSILIGVLVNSAAAAVGDETTKGGGVDDSTSGVKVAGVFGVGEARADWVALLVPTTASGELWLGCPGRASWWGHRSPFRQNFNGVALLGRGRPCGSPRADGQADAGQG